MLKEIGSNFWLTDSECNICDGYISTINPNMFGCEGQDYVWVSSCRSALSLMLSNIDNENLTKVALLPSYTCDTVVTPFVDYGYKVIPFPIKEGMIVDGKVLYDLSHKCNASILLFHRYFGLNTLINEKWLIELQREGVILVEDRTQCLYSDFDCFEANYIVASIRKWSGVPDGGFLVSNEGKIQYKPVAQDDNLINTKIEASLLKHSYLFYNVGEKDKYLEKYRNAEDILDKQECIYSAGDVSLYIQEHLDIDVLRKKRKDNFLFLLRNVNKNWLVFNELNENEVPLYFPIVVDDRKSVQKIFIENSIYAPIIWPRPVAYDSVCEISEKMYEKMICIPIDQRYGKDEMELILNVMEGIYGKN